MKNLLLSALFLGVTLSCSSDDNPNETANNDSVLPTTFTTVRDKEIRTVSLQYNGTKITEATATDGIKYFYTYDGDHITKIASYDQKGNEDMLHVFTYNNGKLIKQVSTEFYSTGEDYIVTSDYSWIDANHAKVKETSNTNHVDLFDYYYTNGNLTKSTSSTTDSPYTYYYETTYTYDTNNNPFKNVKGLVAAIDSDYTLNNMTKKVVKSWTQVGSTISNQTVDTYDYSFEYNSNKYPTKRVSKYTSGHDNTTMETSTYTYTYNK